MTAEKNAETPVSHLATALAAFQAALPSVHKGASGQVQGRKDYKYADLADINGVVLPLLGKVGLSFSAKPTINEGGRFVLAYTLRHTSGEFDSGEYPLPENVTPQQMGSAQTYARRYAIQAMTGVAPDEDDDGRAAETSYNHGRQAPQQRQQPRDEPAAAPPQRQAEPAPVDVARRELAALVEGKGWDMVEVRKRFVAQYGYPLRDATDPVPVRAFMKLLPDAMAATNGVPA